MPIRTIDVCLLLIAVAFADARAQNSAPLWIEKPGPGSTVYYRVE